MEIFIRIILFGCCLLVSYYAFEFSAGAVAVSLGLYNGCMTFYDLKIRSKLEAKHLSAIATMVGDNSNDLTKQKGKTVELNKLIIRDNNQTISQLITVINSTYKKLLIDQQRNLLNSLISELNQQIRYTSTLCKQYLKEPDVSDCIGPLIQFKYSITKQSKGKNPVKDIEFDKLLDQLENLEEKIKV